ncbi:hypothetical protein FHETE_6175 [Fusarium heterosporum]|uniref:Uncharacterized protein n=1 Tax=Fusarium heterosporum TaxID=42747 RepID=A0A8H5WNT0_FUSHE|nr:hypothetical protein FHETE_6175 [Fusarium heterosporum]
MCNLSPRRLLLTAGLFTCLGVSKNIPRQYDLFQDDPLLPDLGLDEHVPIVVPQYDEKREKAFAEKMASKHERSISRHSVPPSFSSKEALDSYGNEQSEADYREEYEDERQAAIANVEVSIEEARSVKRGTVTLKVTITNKSRWAIKFCDSTSPVSDDAYQMGFLEVIPRDLRTDIGSPDNIIFPHPQPSWRQCGRHLYPGYKTEKWLVFPPHGKADKKKVKPFSEGGKFDIRMRGVWHGIQATADPEIDPLAYTEEWSKFTHPFSSNTIEVDVS